MYELVSSVYGDIIIVQEKNVNMVHKFIRKWII